jgi:hypothetical protein
VGKNSRSDQPFDARAWLGLWLLTKGLEDLLESLDVPLCLLAMLEIGFPFLARAANLSNAGAAIRIE